MGGQPAFHLFRFPIHVRPGFLMFMGLVVLINRNEFGVWLAGSAAVLTLLHELGHAFAARATGAEAEISLDFLAGYASFVPVRALKRWERAGISIAGPAVQIGLGVTVLLLMGASPIHVAFTDTPAIEAIRWTGPVMGLFNLVPILPLDGGHIAQAGLDFVLPGRSRTPMLVFSIALTAAGGAWLLLHPRYAGLAYFAIFPLLVQLQMITAGSTKRKPHPLESHGPDGEARAWATGDVSGIPDGYVPSPWFRAHQQLRAGDPDVARALLLGDLAGAEEPDWWLPATAPPESLAALVALLPTPLPHGNQYSELALVTVLHRVGEYEEAVRYGAASFATTRRAVFGLAVAQSAAALGERDTAIAWLSATAQAARDPRAVGEQLDALPDFATVRTDPRYLAIRAGLDET